MSLDISDVINAFIILSSLCVSSPPWPAKSFRRLDVFNLWLGLGGTLFPSPYSRVLTTPDEPLNIDSSPLSQCVWGRLRYFRSLEIHLLCLQYLVTSSFITLAAIYSWRHHLMASSKYTKCEWWLYGSGHVPEGFKGTVHTNDLHRWIPWFFYFFYQHPHTRPAFLYGESYQDETISFN